MTPDVVVDVGNTRIKWGRCANGAVAAVESLPPDAPDAWQRQFEKWDLSGARWAVAGVHPARAAALLHWLGERRSYVWVLESHRQLPLQVHVNHPEKVGIDRLLNAVAVTRHWERSRVPAVVVDAGSAVTVDWVDGGGAFRGGAIFPGLRLMVRALHDYTALLPLIEVTTPRPYVPGMSTAQAIEAGVYYAAAGGINTLIGHLAAGTQGPPHIFLTGGDALLLRYAVDSRAEHWPEMTLEGIRHSAEAQP
jgi:type III pantothenate kinase